MRKRVWIVALATALMLGGAASLATQESKAPRLNPAGNGRFTFALIGDLQYGPEGEAKFPNVIADINADENLAFVVHDGDFKNGSSLCSNDVFFNRLAAFNQFEKPFIYIPGDNEWTDCHRANNGSYDPIERLALLRLLFFPTNQSLGKHTIELERQSDDPLYALFRENVRWVAKNVLFIGLHVVGSNNNFGRTPESTAEYTVRNAANLAWLREGFELARRNNHRAVMIIIQANPNFELQPADPNRAGFNDFLTLLQAETLQYGKPVVLVHGDSHYFRIDKPMIGVQSGRRIENFTRVETFGETDNHWLHVEVAPGNPNVFIFDQRIVAANAIRHLGGS